MNTRWEIFSGRRLHFWCDLQLSGNCSVVCVATHKATDLKCAVKIIDKTSLSNKLRDRLSTEIDLLSKVIKEEMTLII